MPESPGRLVIVGGALEADNEPVWQAVLDGRDGDGPVCVVPTASGSPEGAMSSARDILNRYGGAEAALGVLIVDGDSALVQDPDMLNTLAQCSGFWFTGGQQSRIMDTFLPGGTQTPALEAVRRRFEDGAVVAGTSAGAAIMSLRMIAGGSSAGALNAGIRAASEDEGVGIREGLGFFPTGVVDQHFFARGRIGRLLVAVLEDPEIGVGFGIDENTALVVDGVQAVVVGTSGIVVVDGRDGRAGSVDLAIAGAGDRIDLQTLEVHFDPTKQPLLAGDAPFLEVDILERWAFLQALSTFSTRLDVGMVADFGGRLVRIEKGGGFAAVVDS
ncbi:MAG: cyanophycinase, partial [Gemmatimonadetes bacterium]|nr:cyanophycinase [Gemmatimonadota bacterium]